MTSPCGSPSVARICAVSLVAVAAALCATVSPRQPAGDARDGSPPRVVAPRLVDVNRASAEELALLPGIGPAIAGRIVSDRSERGPFASVDELRRVKGIGAATLERVRPFAAAGQSA